MRYSAADSAMPYRSPDPPLSPPTPPRLVPRGWWLHVIALATPVVATAALTRTETQVEVAVGWLIYATVTTAVWARLRRQVDRWLLAHYALVLLGIVVMGVVIQALQ